MTPLRVVHVSDTHLAAPSDDRHAQRRELACRGWRRFAEQLRADPPDLVVHTGDVVLDDPDAAADHALGRALLRGLGLPVLVVPGNHDVGDRHQRPGQPADWLGSAITTARCARWRARWGSDRWAHDAGDWTLLGLNSPLMGSGLADEEPQWRWLEHRLAAARDGVAVFLHEAPAPDLLGMAPDSWAGVPPAAQRRLAQLLGSRTVQLVGSGHVHRFHVASRPLPDGGVTTYVTAPSLASPIPDRPDMTRPDGDPRTGFVRYTLGADGFRIDPALAETRGKS